jgi:hypothetical protein
MATAGPPYEDFTGFVTLGDKSGTERKDPPVGGVGVRPARNGPTALRAAAVAADASGRTMTALHRLRSLLGRHRRLTAIGAAVVLIAAALVTFAVVRDDGTATTRTAEGPTSTGSGGSGQAVAPLTGLAVDDDSVLDRPALFVKIDNVERARPPAGLRQADIVFEEQVEGNVTRLAAVFHSRDADPLGPVRSVRTTDLELVSLFGRLLFASSGGNSGVLPQLHAADVVDIGANVSGEGFTRASGRPAPHNLITSTDALYGKAPESPPPPRPLFRYLSDGERPPAGATAVGGVALSFGGPEVSSFAWDAGSGTWLRSQRGTAHVDAEGVQLAPRNVVVAEVTYDRSGQFGRSVPHGVFTGDGRVVVLTQGRAVTGRWVRPTPGDPLELVADDGNGIELTPGQTFVELVPPGGWSFT